MKSKNQRSPRNPLSWTSVALVFVAMVVCALPVQAQIYIHDANLSNFTQPITSYATFTNFNDDSCQFGCDTGNPPAPYTPTAVTIAQGFRVYGGTLTCAPAGSPFACNGLSSTNNWIEATFSSPVSTLVVFPNIDHLGSAYDGYQYSIAGSNDGMNWTMLFDATGVNGAGEPFTLGTFAGTAPLIVNNVVGTPGTPGTNGSGPGGVVGYEAFFDFGTAYKYYAFGASSFAITSGNADQELSAVGTGPAAITQPLLGNGADNAFRFGPALGPVLTFHVIYPTDGTVPAKTTMTVSPNVLAQIDCNSAIDVPAFSSGAPTCTTYKAFNNFSAIFDVACSVDGVAPSTSQQCPTTTGFDPYTLPNSTSHSMEDIGNIIRYDTIDNLDGSVPRVPQMLTAPEVNPPTPSNPNPPTPWVAYGVGATDCTLCSRGSGGSGYNSLVVSADFLASAAATFGIPQYGFDGFKDGVSNTELNIAKAGRTIPLKWCLTYPTMVTLGFNGGPVTNLSFPPLGYLTITAQQITTASVSGLTDNFITTTSNAGLLNLGGGCYNFGWSTQGQVAPGQTWQVSVDDGDGVQHTLKFLFH